jgi:ATP/maltotriose-dependent transcriptional regulator MalT
VQEETSDFLNEMMGLDLSSDEVVRLQTELEGWIASLQLVALTLQCRSRGRTSWLSAEDIASSPIT